MSIGKNGTVATVYNVGKRIYEADISAAKTKEKSVVYNIGYIEDVGKFEPNNKSSHSFTGLPNNSVTILQKEATNGNSSNSIPEKGQPVNSNSMQTGKKYSFPGPKALTANLENLEKAKEREKSSDKEESDSENIRRELGWFRGLDRMWRYEISDKDAKINILTPEYKKLVDELNAIKMDNNSSFSVEALNRIDEIINSMTKVNKYRAVKTLGDILEHDRLYEAYPELADYKVEIVELKNGEAEFDPKTQTIKINKNSISTIDTATIMHEVQHAIQDIEGFASGSSEAYWESIEQEHTEHLKELSRLLSEIRTKGNKELADLACRYVELKQEIYKYDMQSAEVDAELQQIEKKAKSKGCYKLLGSFSLEYLICKSYEEKLGAFSSNFERYQNTAGEIEAEDVKKRFNLLSNKRIESNGAIKYINERVETRPDIDRKNVLFVEGKLRKHIYDIAAKTNETISHKNDNIFENKELIGKQFEHRKKKSDITNADLVNNSMPKHVSSIEIDGKDSIIKRSNREVRRWYIDNVSKIVEDIDQNLSIEEKAKQAFYARNNIRSIARNLMSDEKTRALLDAEKPNKTFEELVESKMKRKGMTREEAIEDIYKTATKTNEGINKELGLDGD